MTSKARKAEIAQYRALLLENILKDKLSSVVDHERYIIQYLLSKYYKLINSDSRRFTKVLMRSKKLTNIIESENN